MENSRRCDVCKIDVHRPSYAKHLRSIKHSEKEKQNEMIIPEWLFKEEQAPVKKQIKKFYNPKMLKQIARKTIKIDDKELDKELSKKMINPYLFMDEKLKTSFEKIT